MTLHLVNLATISEQNLQACRAILSAADVLVFSHGEKLEAPLIKIIEKIFADRSCEIFCLGRVPGNFPIANSELNHIDVNELVVLSSEHRLSQSWY